MADPSLLAVTDEPGWLATRRSDARDVLADLPLPQFHGSAGWEFTPLEGLDFDAYQLARAGAPTDGSGLLQAPPDALQSSPLDAEVSATQPLILPLDVAVQRHPDLLKPHLGAAARGDSPFVARNDALWSDGWLVYVPKGLAVEKPIVLVTGHQPGSSLHHRLLVILEEGAEAEVWVERVSASAEAEGIVNGVSELIVGPGAKLRLLALQDLGERTWEFETSRALVERDGELRWTTLGFGSRNGKSFLETSLTGPGAHAEVTGAYASKGRQHLDFDTLQEHAAPNTTSDLAFRGIAAGRSSTVWRGMIKVDPGAQRTDAFQESRNLLLSKRAHVDSIPGLEILADDVRCTHAAAVAQIDPDQLFYLSSHGLPDEVARRLVIEGFLQALLERFGEGSLRDAVAEALRARVEQVLA